ncbi:ankyrin [Plenodomus tracheiphilus IPT5]|uniref:Ankyrin n=1 Tax=Plenodomus tracheiphilus IPT5 TaxID=1408161 RepID=A0A6A7BE32_9PLEO|nr:ankyrin [Plenodomus tracheiphilus IPT5]
MLELEEKKIVESSTTTLNTGYNISELLIRGSQRGSEAVVKLLLDKGANVNVNAQGGHYGNALQAASAGGYKAVVKLLLDKGADPNAQGHEAVVKLLLDKGADPNAQGGKYGNALWAASEEGHEAVVKLLRDAGADIDTMVW